MKRPVFLLSLAALALLLSACATDSYDGRHFVDADYAFDGYYDGFYGPIYDGYWGNDGSFYYRRSAGEGFRHGDHNHFRQGTAAPNEHFQPMHGNAHPMAGTRMPHFSGPRANGGGQRNRH